MIRSARCLVVLGLLALASACASLDEQECRSQDWYSIGVRDGANGRGEEKLLDHAKACAEYGIQPQREAWMEGRDEGLSRFCTVQNGLRVGESGSSYNGVCAADEDDFLRGYNLGQQLHRAKAELDSLETEVRNAETALRRSGLSDDERQLLTQRLREFEYRRGYVRRAYDELAWRARQL